MLKFNRFIPILCLFAILCGCAGRQSEVTQQPEVISPVAKSSPEQRSESQETQSTAPNPKDSAPEKLDSATASKSQQSPQSAKPKPPAEEIKTLPELSQKEKELVSKVTKTVQKDTPVSKENPGLVTINRVLLAQEAMWVLSGSFSTDFQALEPNLEAETDEYQFKITQGDNTQAVIQAIAKTEKLHSFTGAAIAIPTQVPESAMCRTKIPSKTPPQAPQLKDGQVTCANDGVLVEG